MKNLQLILSLFIAVIMVMIVAHASSDRSDLVLFDLPFIVFAFLALRRLKKKAAVERHPMTKLWDHINRRRGKLAERYGQCRSVSASLETIFGLFEKCEPEVVTYERYEWDGPFRNSPDWVSVTGPADTGREAFRAVTRFIKNWSPPNVQGFNIDNSFVFQSGDNKPLATYTILSQKAIGSGLTRFFHIFCEPPKPGPS